MILLTETKCKFSFIYERFNCKRKSWIKNWIEISVMGGGGGGVGVAIVKFLVLLRTKVGAAIFFAADFGHFFLGQYTLKNSLF